MTRARRSDWLKHLLIKRKHNWAEKCLVRAISLLYSEQVERLKESLKELIINRRIAIISNADAAPDLFTRIQGGDFWVKYELTKVLGGAGHAVTDMDPDVVIHLFGSRARLPRRAYKIIWIYSHPHKVDADLLNQYDKIFCLSASFIPRINQMGFDAELMIGATSKRPLQREKKYDVVFVGNARAAPGEREIIENLQDIPLDFRVWGRGWDSILPKECYGGPYFDNQQLGELYASSLITLSDHHSDMRQEGFVAIRIFDILASGGFCISDSNPGIKEIFGDTVPQYESPEHLRELIDFYINHPEERLLLMEEGRRIALQHTWEKRARQFLDAMSPQGRSATVASRGQQYNRG